MSTDKHIIAIWVCIIILSVTMTLSTIMDRRLNKAYSKINSGLIEAVDGTLGLVPASGYVEIDGNKYMVTFERIGRTLENENNQIQYI